MGTLTERVHRLRAIADRDGVDAAVARELHDAADAIVRLCAEVEGERDYADQMEEKERRAVAECDELRERVAELKAALAGTMGAYQALEPGNRTQYKEDA